MVVHGIPWLSDHHFHLGCNCILYFATDRSKAVVLV